MYVGLLNDVILPIVSKLIRSGYTDVINEFLRYEELKRPELHKIQEKRLGSILSHAMGKVPFYHNISNLSHTDLHSFPVLTKELLRSNLQQLVSSEVHMDSLDKHHSSGSSGHQSFTYMSKDHTFYLRSIQTYWWMSAGYLPGKKTLQLGMGTNRARIKKLKDIFFRMQYYLAYHTTKEDIKNLSDNIINQRYDYIAGYPSAINLLAENILEHNRKADISGIISMGDKLFDHHVNNINKAFDNPVIVNTYGCAEGLLMGAGLYGNPYYCIMSPHVKIEIVDDEDRALPDGELGQILVTCLTNKAMPLIRYKLGDMGAKLPLEEYPEDYNLPYPLLKKVVGRDTDVIRSPDGRSFTVHHFTGVIEYVTEIEKFQVVYNKHQIRLDYITHADDLDLAAVKKELKEYIGDAMELEFNRVEKIQPAPSGKPQIFKKTNEKNIL